VSSAVREIRKRLLMLVVAILIVHGVAIGLDRIYGFSDTGSDPATRRLFTGVWMLASLVVVLVGLYRIRVARNAAARERR
jgi:hypothetical protein